MQGLEQCIGEFVQLVYPNHFSFVKYFSLKFNTHLILFSVVFAGFSAESLRVRITDGECM